MVIRVGNGLRGKRRIDKEGRAVSPRDIRRCQGLAEGWPWQPLNDPLHLYSTFIFIYIRNSFNLYFPLINLLIDSILILSLFISQSCLISYYQLLPTCSINTLSYTIITTYKSLSSILVSPLNSKAVTTVDGFVTSALCSMFINFFYYNYSSNYIIKPYRKCYGRLINRLDIQVQNS